MFGLVVCSFAALILQFEAYIHLIPRQKQVLTF